MGTARLGGAADFATVAGLDHWRRRGYRIHRGGGLRTGVAGWVGCRGDDYGAVGQRRAGGEAPVAAAVSGDLADRVATAIGECDGSTRFGSTADGRPRY
ncbi:hypothetical protein PPS11_45037 [Pseudomonas putida S11]|nr:hypothetical protein PPS11_45037 [Pseudomonas putida S11]